MNNTPGPVERHQGTAVRCSLDASRGRCMMSLARLRPGFIFRSGLSQFGFTDGQHDDIAVDLVNTHMTDDQTGIT